MNAEPPQQSVQANSARRPSSDLPRPRFRLPVAGHALQISPRLPSLSLLKIGRRLGSLFQIEIFGSHFILASDPATVADVCDDSRFTKHIDRNVLGLRSVVGTGLVARETSDPIWEKANELLRITLSQQSMRVHHQTLVNTLHDFFGYWDSRCDGPEVDAALDIEHLVQEMIARVTFGISFGGFPRLKPHPYIEAMQRALRDWQLSTIVARGRFTKPVYWGIDRRHPVLAAEMHRHIDAKIAEAHENPESPRTDVVAMALRVMQEKPELTLSDEDLRFQIINLIQGSESTNGLPVFALHFLARDPELLAIARAEIDSVLGNDPTVTPGFEQVARMRFLRRAIDESLRIWPTAGIGFTRIALEDTEIGNRLQVCKGEAITVFNPGLHRNAEWGDNSEEFDPNRFLPENVRKRSNHAYKPFGTGKRSCTGKALAIHQSILVLATILNRYDIELDPKHPMKVVEHRGFHPVGVRMKLRRREARA